MAQTELGIRPDPEPAGSGRTQIGTGNRTGSRSNEIFGRRKSKIINKASNNGRKILKKLP